MAKIPEAIQDLVTNHLMPYPHIVESLSVFWGHPEFPEYMDNLLLQEKGRDVPRQGFPIDVFKALREAERRHTDAFPSMKKGGILVPLVQTLQ